MVNPILLLIIIPVLFGAALLVSPKRAGFLAGSMLILGASANMVLSAMVHGRESVYAAPWLGTGLEFSLRLYNFSAFIILAAAFFGLASAIYSAVFMKGRNNAKYLYSFILFSLGLANGAVLAGNLISMLFFWEGLLATLFGMIAIGSKDAFKTATKALIIVGISDLCMMLGIAIAGHLAGTFSISEIHLTVDGVGGVAFALFVIGAIAKAGSMPFHSWIPNAAIDAPLPFMALFPAALEKLVGIYFLARITLDMFSLSPDSWASTMLMIVGAVTIILAVMMALVQKDYKKLLSYHAISQVGYMILGIGTAVPAGIVGGLFHMINNALYKSGLFLTGGSVERQAGTTDLSRLGGLARKMPVTFACFLICAVSISGVPPFNGFFSKELVYDGALERGWVFYILAIMGSFFTAASFLKLGHAAFLGKLSGAYAKTKEAPAMMLIPMIAIASICVIFGLFNFLPLRYLIQPVLGVERLEGHDFSGVPKSTLLVIVTLVVLGAAFLNHVYGAKKTKSGLLAVDHIHHAPVLAGIYDKAERGVFDPYNMGMAAAALFASISRVLDRSVDWLNAGLSSGLARFFSRLVRKFQTGNYSLYIIWSLAATTAVIVFLFMSVRP